MTAFALGPGLARVGGLSRRLAFLLLSLMNIETTLRPGWRSLVCPDDFDVFRHWQCIPSFQEGSKTPSRWVISMRWRSAPCGQSSVWSLRLVSVFVSNIRIMATGIQLPGFERTSSWMQPKETVITNVSVYSNTFLHIPKWYMQIHADTCSYLHFRGWLRHFWPNHHLALATHTYT